MAARKTKRSKVATSPVAAKEQSKPDSEKNQESPKPLRVLALDGGPSALLVVLVLEELEKRVPGFLKNVDVVAGTSSGAITGLMLSTKENPAHMLPTAENFWLNEQEYYKNSLFGYLRALTGVGSINDSSYVQSFLEQRGVLAELKLSELVKKVIVTSFEVNPVRQNPSGSGPRNWHPKIFENLSADSPDLDVLAVDAALSSSASPIVTPIHQGRVDGGLISNNPSMLALSRILHDGVYESHQIVMLSVAGGRAHESLKVNNDSWGYVPWLFNPNNPLLLLNAFLAGSTEASVYDVSEVLDDSNFYRLDPYYTEPGLLPFVQANPRKQQEQAASDGTKEIVRDAAMWLQRIGWIPEPGPSTGPGAAV